MALERRHYRRSAVVFFTDTATTEIYTLSLHDALPICGVVVVVDDVTEGLAGFIGRSCGCGHYPCGEALSARVFENGLIDYFGKAQVLAHVTVEDRMRFSRCHINAPAVGSANVLERADD